MIESFRQEGERYCYVWGTLSYDDGLGRTANG